jgi:F-type H+-transporting ATPase subunit delta
VAAEDRTEAYAAALFEVARGEGDLRRIEDELVAVRSALRQNDALRESLTDQAIPVAARQGIVEDLLGPKASPTTTNLVSFVVGAGRGRDLIAIIDKLVGKAAESRSEALAEVTSATPLDGEQQRRLAEALARRFGHAVSVKVTVDPAILGGIIAQVGDTVIDGSVRARLDQLKHTL